MNSIFTLIALPITIGILSASSPGPTQDIDSSEDEIKVKAAVVKWADATFYSHTEYKFEHFKAIYTDDYFIAVMRADMYKKRLVTLEKQKSSGSYKKSDTEYENEYSALKDNYVKAQTEADNFTQRAEYYRVHFWSNIQTNDGITVYYEHIMKVDNAYNVIEATENSAIGKKSSATKILYNKDIRG
jgi:hypothetical protein